MPARLRVSASQSPSSISRPEADVEEFIAARLAPQRRLLDDPPLALRTVVYESVLHNLSGGPNGSFNFIERSLSERDSALRHDRHTRLKEPHLAAHKRAAGLGMVTLPGPKLYSLVAQRRRINELHSA